MGSSVLTRQRFHLAGSRRTHQHQHLAGGGRTTRGYWGGPNAKRKPIQISQKKRGKRGRKKKRKKGEKKKKGQEEIEKRKKESDLLRLMFSYLGNEIRVGNSIVGFRILRKIWERWKNICQKPAQVVIPQLVLVL